MVVIVCVTTCIWHTLCHWHFRVPFIIQKTVYTIIVYVINILSYFVVVGTTFGYYVRSGEGPIFLDGLMCTGEEESLLDCNHRGVEVHSCSHYEDASVRCYNG